MVSREGRGAPSNELANPRPEGRQGRDPVQAGELHIHEDERQLSLPRQANPVGLRLPAAVDPGRLSYRFVSRSATRRISPRDRAAVVR
jgi:hypothetical protein